MNHHHQLSLDVFRTMFPEWENSPDMQLELWQEIAGCMICLPEGCPKIAEKIPYLLLAHILRINNITAPVEPVEDEQAGDLVIDECDESFLNSMLASGAKLSTATIGEMAVSFNSVGLNSLIMSIGTDPFSNWLAMTSEGQMVAVILSRMNKGPHMALAGNRNSGVYADDHFMLGHLSRRQ